jgi:hypothetical protein
VILREGLQVFVNVENEVEKLRDHAAAIVQLQDGAANEKSVPGEGSMLSATKWPGQDAPAIE